jgi:hypothetical protein
VYSRQCTRKIGTLTRFGEKQFKALASYPQLLIGQSNAIEQMGIRASTDNDLKLHQHSHIRQDKGSRLIVRLTAIAQYFDGNCLNGPIGRIQSKELVTRQVRTKSSSNDIGRGMRWRTNQNAKGSRGGGIRLAALLLRGRQDGRQHGFGFACTDRAKVSACDKWARGRGPANTRERTWHVPVPAGPVKTMGGRICPDT